MLLFAIQIIHPTNFSTYSRLHPCVRWTVMHILEARTRVFASCIRAHVGHGHDTFRTLFFFYLPPDTYWTCLHTCPTFLLYFFYLRHIVDTLGHIGNTCPSFQRNDVSACRCHVVSVSRIRTSQNLSNPKSGIYKCKI